jgi:hypothetical protein
MKDIVFKLPEGVQVPDGKIVGDTFQAMATFELEAGGKVCLKEVDGESINPSASDDEGVADESANDDTTNPGPSLMQPGGMQSALMCGGS